MVELNPEEEEKAGIRETQPFPQILSQASIVQDVLNKESLIEFMRCIFDQQP